MARSLSGGELRRVSIAQELVADAQTLLLDEPTSGLDSSSALNVVELLRQLALSGRIVLTTLHQPSGKICACFDDLLVLGRGRVCFRGEWAQLVPHLQALGFEVPPYYSPAETVLDLTMRDDSLSRLWAAPEPLAASADASGPPPASASASAQSKTAETGVAHAQASFAMQCQLLWRRSFQQFYRNELMLVSEACQYILLGLLIALIYGKSPDSLAQGSFNRISAIFFVLTTLVFVPSFTQVAVSAEDFPLLKREVAAGWYGVGAHLVAKTGTAWPFELLLLVGFQVCCYFICGFASSFAAFWTFYLVCLMFLLIAETSGLICACMAPNATIGVLVLSVLLVIFLGLGGFLVDPTPA